MFVIFLLGCLVFGVIAMLLVVIGHGLYIKMSREEEKFDIEKETYETMKEEIKKERKK